MTGQSPAYLQASDTLDWVWRPSPIVKTQIRPYLDLLYTRDLDGNTHSPQGA